MAWLYKRKGSSFWWLGWRVGRAIQFRSTKTSDRKEAEKELAKVHTLFTAHKAGTLEAVYQALSGKVLLKLSLKAALEDWLSEVKTSNGRGTFQRYEDVGEGFASYLEATETKPLLPEITSEHIRGYLKRVRAKRSASTTNLERKILSIFFGRAIKNQQLRENPVLAVRAFTPDQDETIKRRSYTVDELRLIYRKAPNEFWQYMIVGGFYTGLRMGDLITLRWESVDFEENMVRLMPRKTRRKLKTVHVPIAAPFREVLEDRKSRVGKPVSGHIWPVEASTYVASGSGHFSNDFYSLVLAPCGLVPERERSNGTTGRGRLAGRQANFVSFHSLRRSFVTLLKATGGSQIVAKELAGHSSDMISDVYTTLPKEVLTKAIDALPMIED